MERHDKCDAKAKYKQGENIGVQIRLFDDESKPITELSKYEIYVLLRSQECSTLLFGTTQAANILPIETDSDGYLAFLIDASLTQTLLVGTYYIEIQVKENGCSIISDTTAVFEIIDSEINALTSNYTTDES